MAITLADFNKIWASTSPLTPYSFSEANYKRGWNFIGSTPPARQMWDSYMKASDEKHQWLYNNKLSLSGGTMTGGLTASSIAFIPSFSPNIYVNQDYSDLKIYGGTAVHKGGDLQLFGKDSSLYPGYFRLAADDGTNRKQLIGTPGGSLTWDNNAIALAKDVLPLSGGTLTGDLTINKSSNGGVVLQFPSSTEKSKLGIIGSGTDMGVALLSKMGSFSDSLLALKGSNKSDNCGFDLRAGNGTTSKSLIGKPDGTITWGGNAVWTGNVTAEQTPTLDSTNVLSNTELTYQKVGKLVYVNVQTLRMSANATATYNGMPVATGFPTPAFTQRFSALQVNDESAQPIPSINVNGTMYIATRGTSIANKILFGGFVYIAQ